MASVEGSSTISNVFVRNGGGPTSCSPSIGCGEKLEDDEDDEPTVHVTTSSSFTNTPSMVIGFPKLAISRNLSTKRLDFYMWKRILRIGFLDLMRFQEFALLNLSFVVKFESFSGYFGECSFFAMWRRENMLLLRRWKGKF